MRKRTLTGVFGVIGLAILATMTASASVPVGAYAVVDKVILEPADADPQRIQIWGVFALWDETTGAGYRAPERGYLYYRCPKEQIATCRNEWADLKSVAGSGETIGFGSRSLASGRVRGAREGVREPNVYPIQFGIIRMGSPRGAVFDQLRALTRSR